jgi:hypothetical protein
MPREGALGLRLRIVGVGHIVTRRSHQAPPMWRMLEALVDEIESWWIPVEGECPAFVIETTKPNEVVWSSPFARWPDDRVLFRLSPWGGSGSTVELLHQGDETLQPMDEAALKHRWGQHLDSDLRKFVDDGWPPDKYHFTPYRVDLEDWSVSDDIQVEQQWHVDADLWVSIALDPQRGWWLQRECLLPAGSVLWVVGRRHHQMAVRCLPLETSDLEERLIPDDFRQYSKGQIELLVPVADFAKRMHATNAQ